MTLACQLSRLPITLLKAKHSKISTRLLAIQKHIQIFMQAHLIIAYQRPLKHLGTTSQLATHPHPHHPMDELTILTTKNQHAPTNLNKLNPATLHKMTAK